MKKNNCLALLLIFILLAAVFLVGCDKKTYTLNITVFPEEGGEVAQISPQEKYKPGDKVYLTAEANDGWFFSHWQGDIKGSEVEKVITMEKDITAVAVFLKQEHELTVIVSPEDSGTVEVFIPVQIQGVEHGQTIELTAKPNAGYTFTGWEGDLSGDTNPTTLLVDEAKTVTAVFVPSISGRVIGSMTLEGICGVIIEHPDGEVITDSNGYFTIKGVDTSGPLEITPKGPEGTLGAEATPVKREVNWPNDDVQFTIWWMEFVLMWGEEGTGTGQFDRPTGIAADAQGNIYVADWGNHRIQKFTAEGEFLTRWGTHGCGNAEFIDPTAVEVDGEGNVYVADRGNQRIQKFTSEGVYLGKWGEFGTDAGKFDDPFGLAVDSSNNVYVTDSGNNRIQKFNSDGDFISQWGVYGVDKGQFKRPIGLAIDSYDNVYVSEFDNHRIQKFTGAGLYDGRWGELGWKNGEFNRPYGMALDAEDNIYVPERESNRVQVFTSEGVFLGKWGEWGMEKGQFNQPFDTTVCGQGYIYVIEAFNHRIQKFIPVN